MDAFLFFLFFWPWRFIFIFCNWHACACSYEVHACCSYDQGTGIENRELNVEDKQSATPLFSRWPIILYLSTRGRRSCASLAHPLVLHYGRRRRPPSPGGGHLGQSPLLLPTTPGHQEEPAVSGLSQLLAVLPVFKLVLQYGHPRGGASPDSEVGQPGPPPYPLLKKKRLAGLCLAEEDATL